MSDIKDNDGTTDRIRDATSEAPSDTAAPRYRFFAACPLNVADMLSAELRQVGVDVVREHPAGVSFEGPLASAYRACLHSRTASRVASFQSSWVTRESPLGRVPWPGSRIATAR